MASAPLVFSPSESIVHAVSRLVDDWQNPREPTHSDIGASLARAGLAQADPHADPAAQRIGKQKRVRQALQWAPAATSPPALEFDLLAQGRGAPTLDGIILSWNAAAEKLYGYSADEIVGKSVSLLMPADRPDEMEDILVRLRRGERVDHFESVRARKDGTLMAMSLTISPIRDTSGNVTAASCIARDITDRRRAEDVPFRLAAFVESTEDAILSLTLDGVILTWNRAAATLYGYTAEEILGKSVSVLVPADRHHKDVEEMLSWVRSGSGIQCESIRLRKDGAVVPMWLTISPVRDASGNVAAALTIARDITEHKRTEAALATARDQALVALEAKSRSSWTP